MDSRRDIERWVAHEKQGDDDEAEAAFAQVFSALPRLEPTVGFIERTVGATLRMRARQRAALALGRAAACIVIAAGGVGLTYAAVAYEGAFIAGAGAAIASRALALPIVFVANQVEWWSTLARVAASLGEAMVTPQTQAAIIAAEIICVLAVYALQRLLRAESGTTDSWEART